MARKQGISSSVSAQAALRKQERSRAELRAADLQAVMATASGRRFMYQLIYDTCGVENGIWNPSAEIHYLEGRRSVGISLKNEMQVVAPDQYLAMIQERILEAQVAVADHALTEED